MNDLPSVAYICIGYALYLAINDWIALYKDIRARQAFKKMIRSRDYKGRLYSGWRRDYARTR